jgi:hypothetical protein
VTAPLRPFRPRLLQLSADEIHARLTSDAETTVLTATAAALTSCAALLRRWGLVVRSLPTVSVATVPQGGIGSVEVRWGGREDETGWLAMTGWLVVTPDGPDDSVVTLYTARPATLGLHVPAWTELHRRRVAELLVDHFLAALADRLDRVEVTGPPDRRPEEVLQ